MNHRLRILRERRLKLAAVLCILTACVVVVLKVENMLTSFLLAFVIYYLIGPLVSILERAGLHRTMAVLIPFVIVGGLLVAGVYLVLPLLSAQISSLKNELPKYIEGTSQLIATTESNINVMLNNLYRFDFSRTAEKFLLAWSSNFFQNLPTYLTKITTTMILAPFFAFFMLQDGRSHVRRLLALVPNNIFELSLNLVHQLNAQMGDFIRARLLEAAIVGLVVWVGIALLGFPYATLLATFAAVTNLIPYIGPIIGAVPGIILALINGTSGFDLTLLIGVYAIAQIVDMLFIIPLVVAKIVDLHPVTVVVVIIIGAQLLGVIGMIISIPVASASKLIISSVFNHLISFRY